MIGNTYNNAKPIAMIIMPPRKDHIPVPNSGKSVRSNTKKPKAITEMPMMFLSLDVIGSMICHFIWCLLYVLCTNLLKNGINYYLT